MLNKAANNKKGDEAKVENANKVDAAAAAEEQKGQEENKEAAAVDLEEGVDGVGPGSDVDSLLNAGPGEEYNLSNAEDENEF